MKLLLTSNGLSTPPLEQAFANMVGDRKGLKVALIPTASDPIEWVQDKDDKKKYTAKFIIENKAKHDKWWDDIKKEYEQKGYKVVIADLKEDPEKLREKLQKVDIIDVGGGDINYLLDWAKIAKLGEYLKELLDRGVIYIGASAGNGLLIPDIGFGWWEPGMYEDHISFGIVDFGVAVHQKESDMSAENEEKIIKRREHLQTVGSFPWKIYLLQDGQAIKVDGDKIEHIGPGIKKSV